MAVPREARADSPGPYSPSTIWNKMALDLEQITGIEQPYWMESRAYVEWVQPILAARQAAEKKATVGSTVTTPVPGSGSVAFGAGGGGGSQRIDITAGDIRRGLASSGFSGLGFNVNAYIQEGARRDKSIGWVVDKIIADDRFKDRYSGLLDRNGVMKMSPTEYDNLIRGYDEIARQNGFNMTRKQLASNIARDVSPNEFQFNVQVGAVIRDNAGVFKALQGQIQLVNSARIKAGAEPLPQIRSTKDAANFVAGKAPKGLYLLYEGAVIQAAAQSAGIDVTASGARGLARAGTEQVSLEQAEERYARIAKSIRTAGVELRSFGVNQRQLEIIEFGGAGRAQLAEKAEQALQQREAALKGSLATQRTGLTNEGRPVTQSNVSAGY